MELIQWRMTSDQAYMYYRILCTLALGRTHMSILSPGFWKPAPFPAISFGWHGLEFYNFF